MKPIAIFRAALLGVAVSGAGGLSAVAGTYDISVDNIRMDTGDFKKKAIGYNNSQIPTILRFKEGEKVTINVTNNLRESTSIHWHGLILPFNQDGVPGISFNGIKAGTTFTYNFPIEQAGTYWFHSHSGFQEPDGAYGAIVIEPKGRDSIRSDRDYVVQLTDKHPHSGKKIFRNVKQSSDYYNRTQRTLEDLIRDSKADGLKATLQERKVWGAMRMTPTDVEDIQGFTPLINGQSTKQNWTGIFKAGEKVRLRLINSSAMTYFDVRIPGLKMTVVQADGNNVKPVKVDELRIAVAETYDVIVRPTKDMPYSVIAESMGRTGLVRGTLSPQPGLVGGVPALRKPPLLTMADMAGMTGMDMGGMDMGGMQMNLTDTGMGDMKMPMDDMSGMKMPMDDMSGMKMPMDDMSGMKMPKKDMSGMKMPKKDMSGMKMPKKDMSGMKMSKAGNSKSVFYAPGSGLTPHAANGGKFLSYDDLKASKPLYRDRKATRTIEMRLTGNMERYIWSINGVKMDDAEPIMLKYGERVRFKFINETMMAHPMHLHGMWSILDTGKGKWDPVKHTINVMPGTTVYTETEVDAAGQWAFHCHLSYHAEAGMFRKVVVVGGPA